MDIRIMGVVWILVALGILGTVNGRIHKLEIRGDSRRYIALTTFGFYEGGNLTVNLINFKASSITENSLFGFSLDRTRSDAMNPYLDSHQERCLLQNANGPKTDLESRDESSVIYLVMDFKSKVLRVNCSNTVKSLHLSHNPNGYASFRSKRKSVASGFSDTALFPRKKRDTAPHEQKEAVVDHGASQKCSDIYIPISEEIVKGEKYYNTNFTMLVTNPEEEGRYNLFFHSCPNYNYKTPVEIDFTMRLVTKNKGNFLSAGEMPLPSLYFMMSLVFFLSGIFWVYILKQSKNPVFKIHYLMAVLVFLKSLSLLFHGINFHFIQTKGEHVAAWAILYYITHLLKGAVLFITIVLVGTGWDFIKHILADKDKKIFMIVIPLQVLANVAEIIIEESEEGDIEHKTWRDVFILVDLLCCGAILFPVAWSIKHLQESAHIDGKAAVNLQKLKLFRHFYILIVCYIYFTRIIVYLLKMTVPFQYEWLDEMFREMATYIFFVLTGYKFRPASANPYFTVNDDDLAENEDDDEMDIVLFSSVSGASGITEGLGKVSRATKVIRPKTTEMSVNDEERDSLINKREASHEYD